MSQETNNSGNTCKVILPSGKVVTLREQNGGDDETVSLMSNAVSGTNVSKFLAGLVLEDSEIGNNKPSYGDIEKWKLSDKYYAILKSRIHSIGDMVNFDFKCPQVGCKSKLTPYTEDLTLLDSDLSQPPPEKDYNPYKIKPYPYRSDTHREFTLSSGKKVRYEYKTSKSEQKLLEMDQNSISKVTEFTVRNLEIFTGDKWVLVTAFSGFSAKDMKELRKDVSINDPQFEAISEVTCAQCGTVHKIPLIAQRDFFFPGEI